MHRDGTSTPFIMRPEYDLSSVNKGKDAPNRLWDSGFALSALVSYRTARNVFKRPNPSWFGRIHYRQERDREACL
jgi:hypothetical protein